MKKLLLIAAMSAATTTPVFAQASNFEGFSAGLGLAAVGVSTKVSESYDGDSYGLSLGKDNVIPGVDLSYTKAIDSKLLVGFGVTYDLAKSKSGEFNLGEGGSIGLEAKNHYSVYVQPQYLLNNTTAVFAKLGYHQMKGSISGDYAAAFTSEKYNGIGYGVGIKTFIDKNLFVQVEGQIVDFKQKSFDYGDGYIVSYKPKSTAGIVTLGYKF